MHFVTVRCLICSRDLIADTNANLLEDAKLEALGITKAHFKKMHHEVEEEEIEGNISMTED